MKNPPDKCLIDTNVPIVTTHATQFSKHEELSDKCIAACVEAIEHIVKNGILVVDEGGEIISEYLNQFAKREEPDLAREFMIWIINNQWNPAKIEQVSIQAKNNSFAEFPVHEGLNNFDPSDRKFVAVSNAHPDKPPILQATDSKWWGWKGALSEVGIDVHFLCPDYIKGKYSKKMKQ